MHTTTNTQHPNKMLYQTQHNNNVQPGSADASKHGTMQPFCTMELLLNTHTAPTQTHTVAAAHGHVFARRSQTSLDLRLPPAAACVHRPPAAKSNTLGSYTLLCVQQLPCHKAQLAGGLHPHMVKIPAAMSQHTTGDRVRARHSHTACNAV